MHLRTVMGQESWDVSSPNVRASVTRVGGMLGPVEFDLAGRTVSPLSVAPWHSETGGSHDPMLGALRGDFFCMPFGRSPDPYLGEDHPMHGETANGQWQFDNVQGSTLDLVLDCSIRRSRVYKTVRCGDGAIYQRHTLIGLSGPMSFGTHCMVRFQSPGLIGLSPTVWHQVYPGQFEDPSQGGYSSLLPGAEFDDLHAAPLATGGFTDLLEFPARSGYDDLVQVAADPSERVGWSAVTFPEDSYVFFQLKDPRVLTGTVLWYSNGGRHYAPWNSRHRAVVGIEEVTSYFHLGLRGSVSPNPMQARGMATYLDFNAGEPLEVKTVLGVAVVPEGFDRVSRIVSTGTGIVLLSESGMHVEKSLDPLFMGFS